jgi:hypothetical protein
MPEKRSVFISRAGADQPWAELIAGVVRDAGHEAIHQDDFRIGASFIHNMRAASANSDCTIAVLSPTYFQSQHCLAELNAALASDPNGLCGQIFPVLVAPCDLPPDLAHLTYLDLVGTEEDVARRRLMSALLKHGQTDAAKLPSVGRTRRVIEQANRNRRAMIEKVRMIWITGFLHKALFQETRLRLGLCELPDAVARPMDLPVQRPDREERPLPPGTGVVQVYDEAIDHALLILGEPGSGKSTMLLELARDLLDRAGRDLDHPMPVVFPLSTWAESRRPLAQWLVEELILRCDVPRKLAQEWVENEQVLPLLDGLDEVKAEHRAGCARAINDFRREHCLLPLVITSRSADYQALGEPLRLQCAIRMRPVTREQVIAYLDDLHGTGEPLRSELGEDPSLWDLLDTPLLLNIACAAFHDVPESPALSGTLEERRDLLFGRYVDQMLRCRAVEPRYSPEQTMQRLKWLATNMIDRAETVFYLDRLQLDWLPEGKRRAARLLSGLVLAVVLALGLGLVLGLLGGLLVGVWFGIAVGLFAGLALGLLVVSDGVAPERIICAETIEWSFAEFRGKLGKWLIVGLVGALVLSPFLGLAAGLAMGLVGGLCGALAGGWRANENEVEIRILPNQGIRRSLFNSITWGLHGVLVAGLIQGLLGALLGGLVAGRSGTFSGALFGAVFGVLFGGLYLAMSNGGTAVIRHCVLRLWLVRNGSIPWNYVRFLDHAAERILLRKVGGGYTFIHRMLLEHFAARYVLPSASSAKPADSSGLKSMT